MLVLSVCRVVVSAPKCCNAKFVQSCFRLEIFCFPNPGTLGTQVLDGAWTQDSGLRRLIFYKSMELHLGKSSPGGPVVGSGGLIMDQKCGENQKRKRWTPKNK